MTDAIAFGRYVLDRTDRRLSRDGAPVELSARYFDALALLVEESGRLVTKDRFMDTVWRGVPVTDEALTQCIRSLRKALGDEAARPRFIETVPKHGYRFIAEIEATDPTQAATSDRGRRMALLALAGTIGGGLAGFAGGLVYGLAGASEPLAQAVGGVSILLVVLCICIAVALLGAAGVSLGIALAARGGGSSGPVQLVAGGAVGGLLVGLLTKLVLLDAFRLLFGRAPAGITGAVEGLILGTAVGLGGWLAARRSSIRRGAAVAALCGAGAGLVIAILGRPLMAGSLALLADQRPGSSLSLDGLAQVLGEAQFGMVSRMVTATLEGALFAAAIVVAMRLAADQLDGKR